MRVPEANAELSDANVKLPDENVGLLDAHVSLPAANAALPDGKAEVPAANAAVADADAGLPDTNVALPDTNVEVPNKNGAVLNINVGLRITKRAYGDGKCGAGRSVYGGRMTAPGPARDSCRMAGSLVETIMGAYSLLRFHRTPGRSQSLRRIHFLTESCSSAVVAMISELPFADCARIS